MNTQDKKISAENEKVNKGSKAAFIIGIVICVILVPILIMNCALIVVSFANPDKPPSLFGYTPMIVLTDSMEPLIMTGDVVIAKAVDPNTITEGDVISFFDPASPDDAILTHRVISIYEEDGVRYANTAGDNNANSDYQRDLRIAGDPETGSAEKKAEVAAKATIAKDKKTGDEYVIYEGHKDSKPVQLTEDVIIGTYSYTRLPFVGKVSMFMQTTWGWVICIAVPLLAFLAYELITRKKKDKSKEKDMDALLAELEALKAAKAATEGAPVAEAEVAAPETADAAQDDSPKDDAPAEAEAPAEEKTPTEE